MLAVSLKAAPVTPDIAIKNTFEDQKNAILLSKVTLRYEIYIHSEY